MGCGGNSTSEVLDQLREFDLRGADAILSVTPYYNKPSQEGLYQHFRTVSEHSPLPVILYNIPGRSGVNMTAETTLRLARDMKNVIGIKEASGDIEQMQRILDNRPEGFLVLSGDDGMTLDLMRRGGEGVISVAANVFPNVSCSASVMPSRAISTAPKRSTGRSTKRCTRSSRRAIPWVRNARSR